ncbi:MAG: SpoIIE family protein phosphatase [Bacteroidetes bacterium]|nr:SpoIIE family protein phosphatase [Bacteroidota bacterium]
MRVRHLYISFLLFIVCSYSLTAQQGNGYTSNFSTAIYKGSDQNWDAVQDTVGKLYFANLNGVIMYDGRFWKTVRLLNNASVFSLDKDNNDKIYVGGDNEFGCLQQNSNGIINYVSLSKGLSEKDKEFTTTWATHCIESDVFFCSNEKLFWYNQKTIKSFSPEGSAFHTFFKVGKHLFVREYDKGFKVFENGELHFIQGSEEFADKKVYAILNVEGNTYMVATRNDGVYILYYNDKNPTKSVFVKRTSLIDTWLKENELYCGSRIGENRYAFGSLKGGMIITDRAFRIISKLNSNNGLQDDAVKNIYQDSNDNLWLSLNFGIAFYENNTPITFWKKTEGVKGVVENVIIHKGNTFAATDKGLLKLNENTSKFEETEITIGCFSLANSKEDLFIASVDGLYLYDGKQYKLVLEEFTYSVFYDSIKNDLYVGTDYNLYKGKLAGGKYSITDKLEDIGAVRYIASDKEGNIMTATANNGVFVLKPDGKKIHLTTKEGLPGMNENHVFSYNGRLFISTDSGFFEWNPQSENKVVASVKLNSYSSSVMYIASAAQIKDEIWFQSTHEDKKINESLEEIVSIAPDHNKFKLTTSFLNRIQGANAKHFFYDHNKVYIGTNQGLFCYDLQQTLKRSKFKTIISRAFFGVEKDSSFLENYSGDFAIESPDILYKNNQLYVYPAATSYFGPEFIKFSYYLEGADEAYSDWAERKVIEIPKINEGYYVFHLKAKNILGIESEEISFSFTILPPWYRTTWACVSYVLLLIGAVIIFVKLYTKRLKEKNISLENTIALRTKTIVDQKHELEHKNKEIVDSINYAQRIQKSLLASDTLLKNNLKNYFVFFQPKDIVSGDFYWGAELDNQRFVLVTADSTGHGVPGAIMSMLNISCLNEAIEGQKLKQPSDILNYTRSKIIKHLSNDGSEAGGKDGMDCSLISFDLKNNQLSYSAANNPIWVVREGSIIELKPDKMPVGKHDRDTESFTQHSLELQKGDVVYALTDGMPDQFGGPKGKKFMYKQLKELLISISHLPMHEQRERLHKELIEWKSDLEQIDDVLVIGVRIA